jgi:hypothetical protein
MHGSDRAILAHDPVLDVVRLVLFGHGPVGLEELLSVFRMDVTGDEIERGGYFSRLVAEDPIGLVRSPDRTGTKVPTVAPDVPDLFRLAQKLVFLAHGRVIGSLE